MNNQPSKESKETETSNSVDKLEEYRMLSELEQSTTAMRHSVFTGVLSISFLIPTLGASVGDSKSFIMVGDYRISLFSLLFTFGFIFYCFAVFHYWWYHRYSHIYRKRLKELEHELGIQVYSLRRRPHKTTTGKNNKGATFKMHFDWALYIIGLLYAAIDIALIGFPIFIGLISLILASYIALVIASKSAKEEPLE